MSGGVDKRSALVDEALNNLKQQISYQSLNLLRASEMVRSLEIDYRAGVNSPSKTMQQIRQIEGGLGL